MATQEAAGCIGTLGDGLSMGKTDGWEFYVLGLPAGSGGGLGVLTLTQLAASIQTRTTPGGLILAAA